MLLKVVPKLQNFFKTMDKHGIQKIYPTKPLTKENKTKAPTLNFFLHRTMKQNRIHPITGKFNKPESREVQAKD